MESLVDDGVLIVVGAVLLVATLARVASSFLLLFFVASMLLKELLTPLACPRRGGGREGSDSPHEVPLARVVLRSCLLCHHQLLALYHIDGVVAAVVPLMGRSGPSVPSDLVVGLLVSVATNYFFMAHLGTMFLVEIPRARQVFGGIFGVFLFLATFTRLGFPFSSDPDHPVNQRIFIQHVHRKFNDPPHEDSYVGIVPLDRSSLSHLAGVEALNISSFKPLPCSSRPYCGWAFYLPLLFLMDQMYHVTAPPLTILPKIEVAFDKVTRRDDVELVNLSYAGPEYMSIYLRPCPGSELVAWNIGSGVPTPTKLPPGVPGPQYFVFAAFGVPPVEPPRLNLTIRTEGRPRECLIQVAVVGHYMPSGDRPTVSPVLDVYLRFMPDWTSVIPSSSFYESWTIP